MSLYLLIVLDSKVCSCHTSVTWSSLDMSIECPSFDTHRFKKVSLSVVIMSPQGTDSSAVSEALGAGVRPEDTPAV